MKPISVASSSTSRHKESKSSEGFRSFIVTSYNWQDLPSFVRSESLLQTTQILLKFHKAELVYLKNT